jgi:hypothetical protein
MRRISMQFAVWKALCGLIIYDACGVGRDLAKLHKLVRRWPIAGRTVPDASNRACQAVNHACAWYPKHVRCLQRSVVTTCLLRSYGVSAHLVLGARTLPLKAHAWTEVNGIAVNERRDVQHLYQVWERC